MRIDDINRPSQAQRLQEVDRFAESQRPGVTDAGVSGDRVEVSDLASSLSSKTPDRLEQLRGRVESGTYRVAADALANSIIEEHRAAAAPKEPSQLSPVSKPSQ